FFFQAEDGIRDKLVTGVQTCALPISCHSGYLDGARVAAEAGVDSIEHGMELDEDIARTMKRNGVTLTSTLSVFASWETFGSTTEIGRASCRERVEMSEGGGALKKKKE